MAKIVGTALAAALAATLLASCYSSSYPRGISANVSLLLSLSDKLADYCRRDFRLGQRAVSSEEMGEFYYALKKARSWAAMTEAHSHSTSYRAFLQLLDAYERFVRAADEYRLSARPDPQQLDALMAQHEEIRRRANAALEALHKESR